MFNIRLYEPQFNENIQRVTSLCTCFLTLMKSTEIDTKSIDNILYHAYRICGVMGTELASGEVDRGFESRSSQLNQRHLNWYLLLLRYSLCVQH